MSYGALIKRFDRHMTRIDEELRLSREAYGRHAEAQERQADAYQRHAEMYDRHAEMYDRHAALYDDHREFIREMTLRIHRDRRATIEALQANTEMLRIQLTEQRTQARAHHEALLAETADHRAQLHANTAAVLKMLDRLDDK